MAHTTSPPTVRALQAVGHVALVAAAYLFATVYVLEAGTFASLRVAYWPAAGVLVGGLLTAPARRWPEVLGVSLVLRGIVEVALGSAVIPAVGFGVGQALVAVGAAWGIQRARAAGLTSVRQVVDLWLVAFGAGFVGALVGSMGLLLVVDEPLPLPLLVIRWWFAHGLGIVTVVPVVLVATGHLRLPRDHPLESILACGVAVLVTGVVFLWGDHEVLGSLAFVPLLPLIWVATRTRVAGAVVTGAAVVHVALFATLADVGPFVGPGWAPVATSRMAAAFIAVVSLSTVVLAVRTDEVGVLRSNVDGQRTLLAAVSHEVRTPLTAITGFSEVLVLRGEDLGVDERERMARAVLRNATHLGRLVEDLLTAKRMELDDVPVTPEDVDLEPFVRGLVDDRQRGDVSVTVDDGPVVARVDRGHLQQIVHNLLDNALRHGTEPITIELADLGEHVRVAVADRGDGVPVDFEPVLFDAFTRSEPGSAQRDGLGLGLRISRVLAVANGGQLTYQRTGDVTRFLFTMPSACSSRPSDPGDSP